MGQVAGTELSLAGKFPYAAGGVVQTKISNTLLVTIVVPVVQRQRCYAN
jgi:hypothetical protein